VKAHQSCRHTHHIYTLPMNKRCSKTDYYVYFLPTALAYRSMHYLRVLRFDGYSYVFFLNVKFNRYETKKNAKYFMESTNSSNSRYLYLFIICGKYLNTDPILQLQIMQYFFIRLLLN